MRVTIAGATGFIGRNLLSKISAKYQLRGLSRSQKRNTSDVEWVVADLFSYRSIVKTLENTDVVIYLVHSMLPTSRLFQGNFQDTDLFLADNFARACKKNNVKQIIYLGGLEPIKKSSKHLDSRKEVEDVFRSTGIPTTVLRAGMVVGDGGSSFEILKNLVLNLPMMVLPNWTKSSTQVVYIEDLLKVIECGIANTEWYNKTINVVNGEKISYKNLIEQSSSYFKGPKLLIPVPINYTSFSKLWVKIFGQADYELVSPLIDSLTCDLDYPDVPQEISDLIEFHSFKEMLLKIPKTKRAYKAKRKKINNSNVRSIQRLLNIKGFSVEEVSNKYVEWLPRKMKNLIKAKWCGDNLNFSLIGLSAPLLVLQRQKDNNDLERIKFHIIGGLLTKTRDTGWLEFRKISGKKSILASINNFVPSLPWFIYKYTQAKVHLKVMLEFGKFLDKN